MDIKKAFSEFYEDLALILNEHGFDVSETKKNALKKTAYGFCEIYFNIDQSYDYTYAIDVKLWVRCDQIQEIRGKINPDFTDSNSLTLLLTPHGLMPLLGKRELNFEEDNGFVINFENQVSKEKWLSGFKKMMNEAVFPFFDSFKTVEDFHHWLNKPVLENNFAFEKGKNRHNAVCGLIAAKLAKSPDYEKIYSIRMNDFARIQNKNAMEELQKTKMYLDEHYH